MVNIDGSTQTVFVVAEPVMQLRTPEFLNRIWEQRGVNAVTVPAHVVHDDLEGFLDSIRANQSALGAVISIPHKQSAVAFCDGLGTNAALTGAINAIRRDRSGGLSGETFDGVGFVAGLKAQGIEVIDMRVLIVGAGGAASAIAVALVRAGVRSIGIANRTPARAELLAERLRSELLFTSVDTGWQSALLADLVINCTPNGMNGEHDSHIPVRELGGSAIAAEVIASVERTPFLLAAESRGLRIHEGRHMLDGQMQLIADYLLEDRDQ